jgi:hypothetical protein
MAQQNYSTYKVVVRSYFDGMTASKATSLDLVFEGYKRDFMSTTYTTTTTFSNNDLVRRNLRASRQLPTWCQVYCPGQCSWCKLNDIIFGQNCNNFCRRRGKETEPRDLQTSDGLYVFPKNRTLFTAQQNADCTLLLSSLVSTLVLEFWNSIGLHQPNPPMNFDLNV